MPALLLAAQTSHLSLGTDTRGDSVPFLLRHLAPGHLWMMSSRCRYSRASSTWPSMSRNHWGKGEGPELEGALQLCADVSDHSGQPVGLWHTLSWRLEMGLKPAKSSEPVEEARPQAPVTVKSGQPGQHPSFQTSFSCLDSRELG